MSEPEKPSIKLLANVAGVVGVLAIMGGLIWLMYHYTRPAPVDQARWAERKRNLNEVNALNRELLDNYAWLDKAKGTVRLSLERAMELTVKEWQNPAAARAAMLAHLEKYSPPPIVTNAPATNAPAPPK